MASTNDGLQQGRELNCSTLTDVLRAQRKYAGLRMLDTRRFDFLPYHYWLIVDKDGNVRRFQHRRSRHRGDFVELASVPAPAVPGSVGLEL